MADVSPPTLFRVFNEIGILEQLASTEFEARLPKGVLVSHFSVLSHLSSRPEGQTPLAMARAFQVPKTTMTHILASVAKRGWVEMRANPADARSKLVTVTEAGLAFRQEAIMALAPVIAEVSEAVDLDWERLVTDLAKLRMYLDARRDGP